MAGLELAPKRPLTKHERYLKNLKFPDCIGRFIDDCEGVTKDKIGPRCKLCPFYR